LGSCSKGFARKRVRDPWLRWVSVDDAIRLGDRVFLLSPRPARILAELPIRTPRNARGQAEITAIGAGIEYLINEDRAKRNGI
jgi:ABC-type nitrate/sulfonate/bicarbonate transport system ATPase subunit